MSCLRMRRRGGSKCWHASDVPTNAQPDKDAQMHMQQQETWLRHHGGLSCHTCNDEATDMTRDAGAAAQYCVGRSRWHQQRHVCPDLCASDCAGGDQSLCLVLAMLCCLRCVMLPAARVLLLRIVPLLCHRTWHRCADAQSQCKGERSCKSERLCIVVTLAASRQCSDPEGLSDAGRQRRRGACKGAPLAS